MKKCIMPICFLLVIASFSGIIGCAVPDEAIEIGRSPSAAPRADASDMAEHTEKPLTEEALTKEPADTAADMAFETTYNIELPPFDPLEKEEQDLRKLSIAKVTGGTPVWNLESGEDFLTALRASAADSEDERVVVFVGFASRIDEMEIYQSFLKAEKAAPLTNAQKAQKASYEKMYCYAKLESLQPLIQSLPFTDFHRNESIASLGVSAILDISDIDEQLVQELFRLTAYTEIQAVSLEVGHFEVTTTYDTTPVNMTPSGDETTPVPPDMPETEIIAIP
jgi:hypothetical protein